MVNPENGSPPPSLCPSSTIADFAETMVLGRRGSPRSRALTELGSASFASLDFHFPISVQSSPVSYLLTNLVHPESGRVLGWMRGHDEPPLLLRSSIQTLPLHSPLRSSFLGARREKESFWTPLLIFLIFQFCVENLLDFP